MFKKGNLVRLINEDEDKEVMRVSKNSDRQSNTTLVHSAINDAHHSFDTGDLELVTNMTTKQLQKWVMRK